MKIKYLIACAAALLCLGLAAPVSVAAAIYNPLGNACQAGNGSGSGSAACSAHAGNPFIGSDGIIRKASNIVAIFASITAVILLMYGGFRYITAGGDAQKLTNARNVIIGAVVGLIIIALAQSIVIFVISKLGT